MTTSTNDGSARSSSSSSSAPSGRPPFAAAPSLRAVVWCALAVRLIIFPFAQNKHGDAPMRALIAERMNHDTAAARDPRSFCQFGPLPIELMRPFLMLDPDARRSSRVLSFMAGMAAFAPFFALGRRLLGPCAEGAAALALAGLALALSPLHVQASTTAASEALYLMLVLAALERLHAAAAASPARRRDVVAAGALMSLAAVTRYDTWVMVPAAAAALLVFGKRDRRAVADAALFLAVSALLPAAYLGWSWAKSGDPFFFGRYITRDHAALAQAVTERLGGTLARVRQVGIWSVSFAAAMTPALFLAACASLSRWRPWSLPRWWRAVTPSATSVVVVAALAPTAAYLAKGLLLGDFEPLPRFALAPGVVLLPRAALALLTFCNRRARSAMDGRRRPSVTPRALIVGGAVAISAVASLLAFVRPGRIWAGAESIGPVTRLDTEDRALAAYLLSNRRPDEGVVIDTAGYNDIVIAHAARVPASRSVTLSQTRQPIDTVSETHRATGATWFAVHDDSWGRRPIPDWPPDGLRFGHWRVAHVGGSR